MADEKTAHGVSFAHILFAFEKHQQLSHRHAPSFIRHVLEAFGNIH